MLTDSRSRIVTAGEAARRECSLHGLHTAICTFVASIGVLGGNHGDVIDARGFAGFAALEGGSGNDVIYAPTGGTEYVERRIWPQCARWREDRRNLGQL